MGAAESRQDLEISESESEEEDHHSEEEEDEDYEDVKDHQSPIKTPPKTPSFVDEIETKLKALKLKYQSKNQTLKNAVKLYIHTGGNTAQSKLVVADKISSFCFVETTMNGEEDRGDEEEEAADESIWKDAKDSFLKSPGFKTPVRGNHDLREEFEEAAKGGSIKSLALGALDNSLLVSDSGIQVVKNFSHGIHGKGFMLAYILVTISAAPLSSATLKPINLGLVVDSDDADCLGQQRTRKQWESGCNTPKTAAEDLKRVVVSEVGTHIGVTLFI